MGEYKPVGGSGMSKKGTKIETFWAEEFDLFTAVLVDSEGNQIGKAGYGVTRRDARADRRYQNWVFKK